jgi:hypothetical protein
MKNKFKNPKIKDKIYVPSEFYVYSGEDDFAGGIATISKIQFNERLPKNHINYIMIGIEENKNSLYNYKILMRQQKELKKRYGNQIAHPNPDYRDEFNSSHDADWK